MRRFGPGERVVPQAYTAETIDRTQGWMRTWQLIEPGEPAGHRFEDAVLA